ncbi:MAG: NAD(P)/FAD-dependent oxidoreductase [Salibacteraceae bacterium]
MEESISKVAIIGGGAAGFFAALSAKRNHPQAEVIIFEKTNKLLSKVKVSGGGRCNVTHNQLEPNKMCKNYPRGEKFLKKAFSQFSVKDTIAWFNERGVELKVEADNRMFPVSNSSQTVIDTFLQESQKLGVVIKKGLAMTNLIPMDNGILLKLSDETEEHFDAIIIALGGQSTDKKFDLFKSLGHKISAPVPSLFTFNISDKITELMGTVSPNALVKIQGTKLQNKGPLLITHWGMSGPAILKLSSLAARELADRNYQFKIQVNWLADLKEDEVRGNLNTFIEQNGKKLRNKNPFDIPNRLWIHFLTELGIDQSGTWNSLDKKSKNRIINRVLNDEYEITKKTTFKEEFVICGGIALSNINSKTMESKITPNLYFAGEFLDIDGITGGLNFQAAWTTGFIAGLLKK